MSRATEMVLLPIVAVLALLPAAAFAQEGQIAGTVRDTRARSCPACWSK